MRASDDAPGTVESAEKAGRSLRPLVLALVLALIAASTWLLSGSPLPFTDLVAPARLTEKIPVSSANVPDEPGWPSAPRLVQPAPAFEWREPSGPARRFSSLRGSVVVLNFSATWCPPCKAEMLAMQRVAASAPKTRS